MRRRHFESAPPKRGVCVKCGVGVLIGWDEGLKVVVDMRPIGVVPEMTVREPVVIAQGRATYVVGTDGLLTERTPARRATNAYAGALYAQHLCPQGRAA